MGTAPRGCRGTRGSRLRAAGEDEGVLIVVVFPLLVFVPLLVIVLVVSRGVPGLRREYRLVLVLIVLVLALLLLVLLVLALESVGSVSLRFPLRRLLGFQRERHRLALRPSLAVRHPRRRAEPLAVDRARWTPRGVPGRRGGAVVLRRLDALPAVRRVPQVSQRFLGVRPGGERRGREPRSSNAAAAAED